MTVELNPTSAPAVSEVSRRAYRDLPPAPVRPPVDKERVLAHLRGLLAELQGKESNHADS